MTPEIIGIIQLVVTVTIGLILLYQNKVLKTKLKAQQDDITILRTYNEIIDINKLKDFVNISEQSITKKAEIKLNELEEQLRLSNKTSEQLVGMYFRSVHNLFGLMCNMFSYEARKKLAEGESLKEMRPYLMPLIESTKDYHSPHTVI